VATEWRRDLKAWREKLFFLALIGIGAVFGILVALTVFDWALEHYRQITMLFFMGLILGSLPAVVRLEPMGQVGVGRIALLALGLLFVLLLGKRPDAPAQATGVVTPGQAIIAAAEAVEGKALEAEGAGSEGAESTTAPKSDYLLLFISGLAAGGAMIVPGVSGSLVMLLLGQYETVAAAASLSSPQIDILIVVAAGAGLGILLFAKLIMMALRSFPKATHAFIVGLVGGSILVLFEGFPTAPAELLASCVFLVLGALLAMTFNPREDAPAKEEQQVS
jgi:putative membrane protein